MSIGHVVGVPYDFFKNAIIGKSRTVGARGISLNPGHGCMSAGQLLQANQPGSASWPWQLSKMRQLIKPGDGAEAAD